MRLTYQMEEDYRMTDRPAEADSRTRDPLTEIEVTHEMRRAGVDAYFAFRPESYEFEEIVLAIHRAMRECA